MNDYFVEEKYKLNPDKWIATTRKSNNLKKQYFFATIFFIVSIIFVSLVKNETRKLQKEIEKLEASIHKINLDLHEANLEYQVVTSPENITELANKYLDTNFSFYKSSQIMVLNENHGTPSEFEEVVNKGNLKNKNKKLSDKARLEIAKKIRQKKLEIDQLRNFYAKPDEIPKEIKLKVKKKIQEKKFELRELYNEPGNILGNERVQQWAVVQVVKAFLGIPIIPGR